MNFDLGSWILQTIVACGGAVATFVALAPTWLGEKLFGHILERRLSALRHDQNQKIEELREQLSHLSDRGKRSNEREFEAISAVWNKFVEAYLSTMTCAISYISHPDLEKLNAEELAAFLGSSELSDVQKKQVADSRERNHIYSKIVMFGQINKAGADNFDARLLLRKNGIFIPSDLVAEFQSAIEVLTKAQVERHIENQDGRYGGKEVTALLSGGEGIVRDLQSAVRARLLRED
jgi:hypothetical protein